MAKSSKATKQTSKRKKANQGRIMNGIHQVLKDANLEHLHVHSLTLLPGAPEADETGPCPPGYVPKQVCVPLPGGGIHCYTKCVPEDQG